MDVAPMAQKVLDNGADEELLPSWSKLGAEPLKAKGFLTYMLQAIFEGKHDSLELDVDYQTQVIADRRVAMMFIASASNKNLMDITKIAQQAVSSWIVITLCGDKDNRINGQRITNRNSEQMVKEVIEGSNKPILILSNQMASRSFSIPEITELYLAYDNGDNGATTQKMSRTLTPSDQSKVGKVFSLSFDPNRDDKFDAMVMEAAIKVKKTGESIISAMRRVLKSLDIFQCTEDGAVKFDESSFIKDAMSRNGLSRAMGKISDVHKLPYEVALAFAEGNIDVKRASKQMAAAKGKTYLEKRDSAPQTKRDISHQKMMAKAREMITTIIENADILVWGTGETVIQDAFDRIERENIEDVVTDRMGVDYSLIRFAFDEGIIKQDWVDIVMEAKS
jgi:hypothetical protein